MSHRRAIPIVRPISFVVAALLGAGCATTTAPTHSPEISSRVQPMPHARDGEGMSRESRALQLFVRGMTEARIGNHETALDLYAEALRFAPNTAAILGASAQSHMALGDGTSAIYSAEKALEIEPDRIHNYFQLAQLYRSNGQSDEAAVVYVKLRERFPENLEALYALARLQAMNGSYTEAVAAYQELLDEIGPDRDIRNEVLQLYIRMDDVDATERLLFEMIAEQPYDLRLRRMLGELYMEQGRNEEAAHQLEEALEQNAGDVEALLALADLYRTLGRADSAEVLLERAATMDATSPSQLLAQAAALSLRANNDEDALNTAERILGRVLEMDPDNTEALVMLGDLRLFEERYSEAGELMYRALQLNPRDPHLWMQSAGAFLQASEPVRAAEAAGEGLLLFPGSLPLLRVSGYALMEVYRNEEAIERFEEVVRIIREDRSEPETDLADLYTALGLLYNRTNDLERSDQAYEEALKTDPNHAAALNNYAYSLAQRNVRLDSALEMAKRAVDLKPDVASFLDTLGWVYFQREDYDDALEWILRAAGKDDASASVYEHLGDVYQVHGEEDQAARAWQKALEMSPSNSDLKNKLRSN